MVGWGTSLPQINKRGQRAITLAKLSEGEVRSFLTIFKKADKDLVGSVTVENLFEHLEEPKSIFTDALLEINDTPVVEGTLSFGDFLQLMVTYIMFEKTEIQQFIYFIFDKDKNGYIKKEELEVYVKVMNHKEVDEQLRSNLGLAWEELKKEFNKDGKVEFREFMVFNAEYPYMFYPAYRLQQKMIERTLGQKFWLKRKRQIQDAKDKAMLREEAKKARELALPEVIRQRKIRKRVGCLKYYMLPCLREEWDKLFPPPPPSPPPVDPEVKKRQARVKAKEEEAKDEIKQRNQVQTLEYLAFQKKKADIQEKWDKQTLKPKRVFRERRVRAEDRRGKWKDRLDD